MARSETKSLFTADLIAPAIGDAFRKLNPLGQIPVLQDGDLTFADSNAIMVYLVRRYAPDSAWLPLDPVGA